MFSVKFGSQAKKFLKNSESDVIDRILERIELLKINPFPQDVKRVENKKEKIFRVRVGKYRIQYSVFYDKNLLFISEIDKRSRAYD